MVDTKMSKEAKTAIIIGASSGLGRALAEHLSALGYHLFLVARRQKDLEILAGDLHIRHGVDVKIRACDVTKESPENIHADFFNHFDTCNIFAYVAGVSEPSIDCGMISQDLLDTLTNVNFKAPISLTNCFLPTISKSKNPNLIFISSVAASRARGKNMIYSASKRGTEAYFQALRHYFAKQNPSIKIQIYRAGYLDTAMNFGEKRPFPKLSPERASKIISGNLGKDGLFYLPWWWWVIMAVYCLVPWSIYKRLSA